MKRYATAALALVLGCTMLTGCRRDQAPAMTMPATTSAAHATTVPTTAPTTEPVTHSATQPDTHPNTTTAPSDATGPSAHSRARAQDPTR